MKFKLLVDNRPMTTLSAMHTKTLTRLQQQMSQHNFVVEYLPGKDNMVADALSRNLVVAIAAMGITDDQLRILQRKDAFCKQVRARELRQQQPTDQEVTEQRLTSCGPT